MKKLKIDFVSDVSCPWCAVGLASLQTAIARLGTDVGTDLTFQPFELNPQMVPEGEDTAEHLAKKYGSTPEQAASMRETIRERGAAVGFTFNLDKRSRIYNTFDAHRLLHWAHLEDTAEPTSVAASDQIPSVVRGGKQLALKQALLKAYFTDGHNPGDHATLSRAAGEVGLDLQRAQAILGSDEFAAEVREQENFYTSQGISSVPAVIINNQHLISGGQPPEVFEQALRQIAAT